VTGEPDILDPERKLALSYVGGGRRPALELLWRLDAALGQILRGATQPITGQLRLAWWREALAALDHAPAPAEPMLQAMQDRLLPEGLSGRDLTALVDGWEQLLANETLSDGDLEAYAAGRGGSLFRLSAELLGDSSLAGLEEAGCGWALVDLARHSSKDREAAAAIDAAAGQFAEAPSSWPSRLRPLGMLAALARRDAVCGSRAMAAPASPGRMLRMLVHRLTGR